MYEKWCKGNNIEDCTHKQQYEESYQSMVKVSQHNTWIDDRKFLKSFVRARAEQGNINHPAYGTLARGQQTSCYGKMKAEQSVLREAFERRHLYGSMQAAQTPASTLSFVTPVKESSMK